MLWALLNRLWPEGQNRRTTKTNRNRHIPCLEPMENRTLLSSTALFAVGAGPGGGPQVNVYDSGTGSLVSAFMAFSPQFTGGVNVAVGALFDSSTPNIVVGAGPGGGPQVNVFRTDGALIESFFAFDPGFTGGVAVAVGDVTGDASLEIVTAAGSGGGPQVAVFDATGKLLSTFFAYDANFTGGVRVATGDIDGAGVARIVTAAGPGGAPVVQTFDMAGTKLSAFLAYDAFFTGGVNVAAGDVTGDGRAEILTGPGAGGGPHVRLFTGSGAQTAQFIAYDPNFLGGVSVALGDVTDSGNVEILTGPGPGGGPQARLFTPEGASLGSFFAFAPGFAGGLTTAVAPFSLSSPVNPNRPLVSAGADPIVATFIDPTAAFTRPDRVTFGHSNYVGPFAFLDASAGPIRVGSKSNIQDNVTITAGAGGVTIGDKAILAHNATVLGNAVIGSPGGAPAFVGFNAVVDGATIEAGAMVLSLARVAPGIRVPTGIKVLPGKFVQTQAEAQDPNLGKVDDVEPGDKIFMDAVIHVNVELAKGYSGMFLVQGMSSIKGIGPSPGGNDFAPDSAVPVVAGRGTVDPTFTNRIIGEVKASDTVAKLKTALGADVAIRGDEGVPITLGSIVSIGNDVTFHGLEFTATQTESGVVVGNHVVIHGGDGGSSTPGKLTLIGPNVTIKDLAVVFRSTVGANCSIGFKAYIDGSIIAPGTVVPDRAIIINNVPMGFVEW